MHILIEVAGPLGCGKTHLLNVIRQALEKAEYHVLLERRDVFHYEGPKRETLIGDVLMIPFNTTEN